MVRFERGDLVRLIDVNGTDTGLAMYMDLHPPGHQLGEKWNDAYWHFSVIDARGETIYLCTFDWTILPADPDSCNP